jgi:menaquinol-cytochrome c reductase iron-sulfur subunit
MPEHTDQDLATPEATGPDRGRRRFLLLVPFGVFAGITATILAAAYRFLRPSSNASEAITKWANVAPVAELKGDKPIMRSIVAEHSAGWASSLEEHFVYVLPKQNNQVLSSVCPHEGCNVTLRDDAEGFFCPCHDSYFKADGAVESGPSRRGLDPLPTRVQDGTLQVQYQSYVNNTEERTPRG